MILQESLIHKVLEKALSNGADFAEIYVENTYNSNMTLNDSMLREASVGRLFGAGIRLFYGTQVIYTSTNDLTEAGLLKAAGEAAQAVNGDSKKNPEKLQACNLELITEYKTFPWQVAKSKKLKYLERLDTSARGISSDISQVYAKLNETHKAVQIANSEGVLASEERQYISAVIDAIAEKDGLRERAHERLGFSRSGEAFEEFNFEKMGAEAATLAIKNLTADYAPAGEFPVVLDKAFGGVIFHEACGHSLETTSIAKNASVFCGKLGEKIAADCVTAIDDGTIANENGSLAMDDEGMPTRKTTLIENGVLKSYIVDKMGAIQTGYDATGSGRRQDYRFAPASRMRNTYFAAGNSNLEEMIGDIDNGIYAKKLGGGSVTPGTGAYNFAVSEAFLIKNGKIDKPIKGASLIGNGLDTLGKISKVGKDLELAAGTCGSVSGWVPVTVGQPPIQISSLTVGGRA